MPTRYQPPESFARTVRGAFGPAGDAWLVRHRAPGIAIAEALLGLLSGQRHPPI